MFRRSVLVLVLFVIISYASNDRQRDSEFEEVSEKTDELSDDLDNKNISFTFEWVNVSETYLWEELNPVQNCSPVTTEEILIQDAAYTEKASKRSWCFDLGIPMANKTNTGPSKFKLTNGCCKILAESMFVDIDNNVSHKCSSELTFHDCLQNVNSTMSKFIGNYYFNILSPYCYSIEELYICQETVCTSRIRISSRIVPNF